MRKIIFILVAALAFSCGKSQKLEIDGSSTVYPITEAVTVAFKKQYPDVKVSVNFSGTGGGFKKFLRKEIDISNASRPISEKELKQAKEQGVEFIELPVAFDGLAVVVHPDNDWVDYMTVAELKKLWEPEAQGKITKWSQIREGWPDKEIHLYGAGTASGTFDYFTEAIVGKAKASRGDYTASEDDNVLVQGISTDPLALGYFGLEYYLQNKDKLKIVPVDDNDPSNGEGPVVPSMETVKNGTYQPLSRPLLVYVRVESLEKKQVVQDYMNFYVNKVDSIVPQTGYIPLSDEIYSLVQERLKQRKTGSVFAELESNVGIKLEEVLK